MRPALFTIVIMVSMSVAGCGSGEKDKNMKDIAKEGADGNVLGKALMPKKDPQKEAQAASERAKRRETLRLQEIKVMETLKKWPNQDACLEGEWAIMGLAGDKFYVQGVAFSETGSKLAMWDGLTTKKDTFKILDLPTGKEISRFVGSTGGRMQLCFSPDESLFAAGGADKQITIWDVNEGKIRKNIPTDGIIYHLAFLADGKHLAAKVGSKFIILDCENGKINKELGDPLRNAGAMALAPRGNMLAFSTNSKGSDRIALFEMPAGGKIDDYQPDLETIHFLLFSPDGWGLVIWGIKDSMERIALFDLESKKTQLLADPPRMQEPVFSPDGKYVAYQVFNKGLFLVDIHSGKEYYRKGSGLGGLHYFPGGELIAAFENSRLRFWSIADLMKTSP